MTAVSVLPTGESMNPRFPREASYFDEAQTAYVLFKLSDNRTRPTRVVTSFGPLQGWTLGSEHELYHDQTNAYLGRYKVVGVHHFASNEHAGDVPDIKIKHCVVK